MQKLLPVMLVLSTGKGGHSQPAAAIRYITQVGSQGWNPRQKEPAQLRQQAYYARMGSNRA